jgi:hypothetical protein
MDKSQDTSNIVISNVTISTVISNNDSINSNIDVNNKTKKTVSFNDIIEVNNINVNNLNDSTSSNEDIDNLRCNYCNKLFKTKNSYLSHKRTQICFSSNDKTYCSVCDILFNSKSELEDHLLSEDHYNCINNLTIVPISKRTRDINRLDPILNTQDLKKINTIDIGSNITFVYNDDNIEKQEITITSPNLDIDNINISSSIQNDDNNTITDTITDTINDTDTTDNNNTSVDSNKDEQMSRKNKIITFLISNANEKDNAKKFLQLLNKLSLEDYNGLNNEIIKNSDIPVLAKQQYIKTIQTFIKLLIKKKNKGEKLHNNNDIQDIVTAISK